MVGTPGGCPYEIFLRQRLATRIYEGVALQEPGGVCPGRGLILLLSRIRRRLCKFAALCRGLPQSWDGLQPPHDSPLVNAGAKALRAPFMGEQPKGAGEVMPQKGSSIKSMLCSGNYFLIAQALLRWYTVVYTVTRGVKAWK